MSNENKYQVVIADDEHLVRERILQLLSPYDNFEIYAECDDGQSTIESVRRCQPDLIFLDIQMPKASGFEVLKEISSDNILVVFVTAFDQYAVRAFEYAAFDYLLKPISADRFDKTISRVMKALSTQKDTEKKTLKVREKGIWHHLKIRDISHLNAADHHVIIHCHEKSHKKRTTLRKMLNELTPFGFIQVHRSHVINPAQIQEMVRVYQGDYLIRMLNGKVIPTSKSFRKNVKILFE